MTLGPIVQGDKSILDHDLTHATSGLPLYPAFDTGFRDGATVIAPEPVIVTRHSGGSWAGWSFYADGNSGLRYYVTHLRPSRATPGNVVERGAWLGTVGDFVGARVPHAHVGINVERLLGPGAQLRHNTNYTHGQSIVGEQLRAHLLPPEEDEDLYPWLGDYLRWNFHGRNEGAPRPANIPAAVPGDALVLADTVAAVIRLTGPPVVYQGWRDSRLVGDVDRPPGTPIPVPKRWWDAAAIDHSFANRYAEKLVAAVSADKAAAVALLQKRIGELEEAIANGSVAEETRDARIRALLEEALTALGA